MSYLVEVPLNLPERLNSARLETNKIYAYNAAHKSNRENNSQYIIDFVKNSEETNGYSGTFDDIGQELSNIGKAFTRNVVNYLRTLQETSMPLYFNFLPILIGNSAAYNISLFKELVEDDANREYMDIVMSQVISDYTSALILIGQGEQFIIDDGIFNSLKNSLLLAIDHYQSFITLKYIIEKYSHLNDRTDVLCSVLMYIIFRVISDEELSTLTQEELLWLGNVVLYGYGPKTLLEVIAKHIPNIDASTITERPIPELFPSLLQENV